MAGGYDYYSMVISEYTQRLITIVNIELFSN